MGDGYLAVHLVGVSGGAFREAGEFAPFPKGHLSVEGRGGAGNYLDRALSFPDEPLFLPDCHFDQPWSEGAWGRHGDRCLWHRESYRFSFRDDHLGLQPGYAADRWL